MAMGTGNKCFETHLIKEDGTLNVGQFDDFLKKVNLAECGLNYAVVSIMGPQSSGKSTLLNHLFGSKFKELDGLQRRGKTTKGVWMARCVGIEPCTLIMDVEGSDGRERGEDDTSFERQCELFAFAVSHIVLINMFVNSVGLEHASKPLLKHVFKGVLRLSTTPRKTTLMFVIRDIIRTTPLENLDPILREDINKIWYSIPKPYHHKRTPLSTFFNIEIVGLPNYVERKKDFEEQVKYLRWRFNHSIAPGGLAGDRRDTIPGSDFSPWAQNIWKTIKELDLPKLVVMIANTRCGAIADEKLKAFANKERRLEESAKTNPAPGFGKEYSKIIKSCWDGYDKETENYEEDVRSEKREHLKEKMMLLVQSALQRILAQIGSRTLEEFKEACQNALKEGKDATVTARNCGEAFMMSFDDRCADVIVDQQANCNTKEERKKLELAIDNDVLKNILQEKKGKEKAIAAGVGGAVMATGVISGAAVPRCIPLFTVGLPATAIAAAATGVFAGFADLGTLIGRTCNKCFETHLIKEDGTLNVGEFDYFLKKVNLAACGLKYAVVSIMGPQSSGKSTLLNHLFGSNFQQLDGLQRRGKTTKGIWMARCVGIEPCTLVMDVEGSDGRERGVDDTSFERRSGLFAFAVSHIVLINMFAHSVGLEQGASKPLLKEVFKGVLRLSTSPHKTTLMFVIRDIVRRTPLDILDPILREDINKIWDSIPKPERHKRTPLSTFFNVEVVGLPNYVEREEEFKEQVKILRQRFNHSIAPGGLAGDSRETILGSDFFLIVQDIWKIIESEVMRLMIAKTRCGEIANKKLNDFVANKEKRQLEEGAQTNIPAMYFRKKYISIINFYLQGYDEETKYYNEGVRSEKRKHLKEKMMLEVQSAFKLILANIRSKSLKEFNEAFCNAVKKGKDAEKADTKCREACLKSFDDRCADVIVEQANCNTKEEREKVEDGIEKIVLQAKYEVQKHKKSKHSINVQGNENAFSAAVGGAVMAAGVIGGVAVLIIICLPATVAATAASRAVAGAAALGASFFWVKALGALGALIGEGFRAYKSKNRKISQSELEATELEGKWH